MPYWGLSISGFVDVKCAVNLELWATLGTVITLVRSFKASGRPESLNDLARTCTPLRRMHAGIAAHYDRVAMTCCIYRTSPSQRGYALHVAQSPFEGEGKFSFCSARVWRLVHAWAPPYLKRDGTGS